MDLKPENILLTSIDNPTLKVAGTVNLILCFFANSNKKF